MLQAEGRHIDYTETGEGPVLLFLPGSYSTVAAWRPVQRLLKPGLRLVTTSLCGYGKSAETRTLADSGIAHEVRLVEAVARQAGGPVHLVGHSFGGTVALATVLAKRIPVASVSLFEANPLDIIRGEGGGLLYHDTLRMSVAFERAVAAGEPDAPRRIIDFWGGEGAFAAMPPAVQSYCRETAPVNVLDWRCDFAFGITADACSSLDLPVLLVRGGLANPAMVAITSALGQSLRRPRTHVVDGAGHFLISSHAAACAELLSAFVGDVA